MYLIDNPKAHANLVGLKIGMLKTELGGIIPANPQD